MNAQTKPSASAKPREPEGAQKSAYHPAAKKPASFGNTKFIPLSMLQKKDPPKKSKEPQG